MDDNGAPATRWWTCRPPTEWRALVGQFERCGDRHLRDLFADDPDRGTAMVATAGDLVLDYSKHRVDADALGALWPWPGGPAWPSAGTPCSPVERINTTEDRAVLHVALRMPTGAHLEVDGRDVVADVHEVLDRWARWPTGSARGAWTGQTGRRIRAVVNIGIGGSDLGPAMAHEALRDYADPAIDCRFVSNIDPVDLYDKTHDLDPAETLFVVCSKTFTTLETLTNAARRPAVAARRARARRRGGGPHFVAVSTNDEGVAAFGIDPANMFGFWDWVGGRYSYDSAIGFSLMVAIGPAAFADMLAGFHAVDRHFVEAPFEANMPVIQGMLNVWYNNLFGAETHAVLPYSQRLARFPAYLQQLTMESNGKSVRRDGSPVWGQTGEIFWGEPGTNGQHAFYQLIHQGTKLIPADFIGFGQSDPRGRGPTGPAHGQLLRPGQGAGLRADGRGGGRRRHAGRGGAPQGHAGQPPELDHPGPELTPSVLGQLVALYEHTVFIEGAVWGIDSFDQWGVELGKVMAGQLAPVLTGADAPDLSGQDSSTAALVRPYRGMRGRRSEAGRPRLRRRGRRSGRGQRPPQRPVVGVGDALGDVAGPLQLGVEARAGSGTGSPCPRGGPGAIRCCRARTRTGPASPGARCGW